MHQNLDAKVVDQIGISHLLHREQAHQKKSQEVREKVSLGQVVVKTLVQQRR